MKKKILFFTTSGDYNGGGVMCLVETLRYIDRSRIEPHVVMPTGGTTEDKLRELDIPYTIIRSYDWLFSEGVMKSVSFKLKAPLRYIVNCIAELRTYLLLKKGHFNAYHLNSLYSPVGVKAANRLGIQVFWHLREFVDGNPWTSVFLNERKSYCFIEDRAYKALAVSQSVKDYYSQKMPKANIEVVYDGVDFRNLNDIRNSFSINTPLRLSMIGGVTSVKGHQDAICAMKELKARGVSCQLTIYGRSRDLAYQKLLENLIEEYGLMHDITFAGNQTDMTKVWKNTDVVLVCSKSESFGRVAIESIYQNIPVIGADNSGTAELLRERYLAMEYATGNSKDLADKIVEIAKHNVTSELLLQNHNYAMKFDAKVCAQKFTEVLIK